MSKAPNTQYLTIDHKLNVANLLFNDIKTNNYYFFMGYTETQQANGFIETLADRKLITDTNIVLGKKVTANDCAIMIKRRDYQTGVVYSIFDQSDTQDTTSGFSYAILADSSYYYIIQCLANNLASPSTATPEIAAFGAVIGTVVQTSDNYQWKLSYIVSKTIADRFITSTHFPIFLNTTDTQILTENELYSPIIESFHINESGSKYDNYIETAMFSADQIQVNGNNILYAIASNASLVNNFYNGCLLIIKSGAMAGEYRQIEQYISNGNGNFIVLDSVLTGISATDQYQIYPSIVVPESSEFTANVVAYAVIDPESANSIKKIQTLEIGSNYNYFPVSANVYHDPSVNVSITAEITPIVTMEDDWHIRSFIDPEYLMVSVNIANSETSTILANNTFSQFGLIKNPKFTTVTINAVDPIGTSLIAGETLYEINPIKLTDVASFTANSFSVTIPATISKFKANDAFIINYSSLFSVMGFLSSQPNTTTLTFNSVIDPQLSQSNVTVYYAGAILNTMTVNTAVDSDTLIAEDYMHDVTPGNHLYSNSSQQMFKISTVSSIDTFNKANSLLLDVVSGTYVVGETITQTLGNNIVSAVVAAITPISGARYRIWYTNIDTKDFLEDQLYAIVGSTSGATGTFVSKYPDAIKKFTGEIVYVEKLSDSIVRSPNNDSHRFKLIFGL